LSAVPENFRFSQSSLSAFAECRRRFWWRYVRRMEWPAPLTDQLDEWEKAIERGQLFHHWAQQDALGLAVDEWALAHEDELLVQWWKNFRSQPPQGLPAGAQFSEIQLSMPLGPYRIVAKFDRIICTGDGRVFIVDWKTGRRKPKQDDYVANWQTLVYRYVMAEAGAELNGGNSVEPEQITLVYWHANFPGVLEPIAYSIQEHERARETLLQTLQAIGTLGGVEDDFPLTEDLGVCRRCVYSALCERGRERADDWDIEDDDISWQEIPETEL
jgi:hypothetical protein